VSTQSDTVTRRRAQALPPDERRASIVAAALPLVSERGRSVTTAEIARAAGVAEGTLFWAFETKEALLSACVEEVTSTDRFRARLDVAARHQILEERLMATAETLDAHLRRALPLVLSLGLPSSHHRSPGRGNMLSSLIEAVGGLLDHDAASGHLAGEPTVVARALVGLVFSSVFQQVHAGIEPASTEDLVGIVLDGVRARPVDRGRT